MFFPEIAVRLQVSMETSGKTACWLYVKFCHDCFLDNKWILKAWPQQTPAVAHGKGHTFLGLRGWTRQSLCSTSYCKLGEGGGEACAQLPLSDTGPVCPQMFTTGCWMRWPPGVWETRIKPTHDHLRYLQKPSVMCFPGQRWKSGAWSWGLKGCKRNLFEKGQCDLKKETGSKRWIQRARI